jgi:hypothetical protein
MVAYELSVTAKSIVVIPKSVMMTMKSVMMVVTMPVYYEGEVCKDIKPGEPVIPPPERIRNPAIKVVVIRRRRIVSNNGRTLVIIIVVYDGSVRTRAWRVANNFLRSRRTYIQAIRNHYVIECFQGLIFTDCQLIAVCCVPHGIPQFHYYIRSNRVIGDPSIAGRYTSSDKHALCLCFVGSCP